jgi:polyisoprenoid-binding protein YceI
MKQSLVTLIVAGGIAFSASAAPQSFDFKDPKGVNNAVFKLDAPLEAINGSANGISGTVEFDADQPAATKGKIVVASKTLTVGNTMMQEHMHSDGWLDVAKFPEISFEVKELKNAKTAGNVTTATAVGTFSLKGVAKELSVPVKLTYLKGKLADRSGGQMKGDLLVVRATFSIKRADFNIKPGQAEDKVANDIELTLSIAGAAPQK